MKKFWNWVLKVSGWNTGGELPKNINKYILAVAPHTSNWDFLIGLIVRGAMGFKAHFLGKNSLFRFPAGFILRKLGGIPVDRSKPNNTVDQIVNIFNNSEHFVLAISPEGTRKKVDKWKTGFYYMAYKAGVPVVFVTLDWENKTVKFLSPFYPSGDIDADMAIIKNIFAGIKGKNDLIK